MENSIIEEAKMYISERRGKPDRVLDCKMGDLTVTSYPRYIFLLADFCEEKGYQEMYNDLVDYFGDMYIGIRHKGR